jgi:energy-converting hydrogenase Eha subunit C
MIHSIYQHIILLLRLKHDGSGLPNSAGAITFIMTLALTVSMAWALVAGPQVAPGSNLIPMALTSIGALVAICLVYPLLGVAMALTSIARDLFVVSASFLDVAPAAQLLAEVAQVIVIVFFYVNSTKRRKKSNPKVK